MFDFKLLLCYFICMNPQDYLQTKLQNCSLYTPTEQDKLLLKQQGMSAFIFTKISSKKFRKWKLDDVTVEQIKKAIEINVENNASLKFSFPFGGYKLWHIPSTPEVDWAEFFMLAYYCEYLAPISALYKPGVHFRFSDDDVIVPQMDNVPPEDTEAYYQSFNALLDSFSKFWPANMKIELHRVADMYSDKKEYEKELATNILIEAKEFESWDADKKNKMLKMSELNIQWQGTEDWTKLSKKDREEKIKEGAILHGGYCNLNKRRNFVRSEDSITVFSTPISKSVAIGTTKSSVAKFWAGFGVLQKKKDSYSDKILSPSQLTQADKKAYKLIDIKLVNLKNFKQVRVYEEMLNFSN